MMNLNPHLQYLQQQQQQSQGQQQSVQQQQPQAGQTQSGQSPQLSQLQLQQLQRQQLLQQQTSQSQPQITTPTSANPLLAILNGGSANSNTTSTPGSLSSNPVLQQLQLQQLQQQQQQQQRQQQQQQLQQAQFQQLQAQQIQQAQQQQQQQQQVQPVAPQSIPIIKEVWAHNLEHEFQSLRTFINDKTSKIYISIHQEIPGIVARPVGTFKSSSDYHFQTLRTNSDLLNLIQLSLCVVKITKNDVISSSIIWQFNFLYDLSKEMYNEEHLSLLSQSSQINFQLHSTQGIPHFDFSELMIESGLILDDNINWISFHAGYDLGFFVSLLSNRDLPVDEPDFYWWCGKYFPNYYDLKYIGNQILNKNSGLTNGTNTPDDKSNSNNKPSIEYLAEELHLLPISPAIRQHFTNSSSTASNTNASFHSQQLSSTLHAYLSMECFKELLRRSNIAVLNRFKGIIWGLGSFNANGSTSNATTNTSTSVNNDDSFTATTAAAIRMNGISTPSTPVASINKGGMVHFGGRV
ncbi:Poly(A) ribonuclease POP2 [Candida tropicalis]